ncbi:hypothetical protein [Streptacidiphilus jiangxiensis]|uniref:Uncharacterized protein n=1 Tax=Streptacidiphilus jiangxiensis TaxID=235985 RepID=A0A1H8AP34_STRJI|nr:hypothetical protein [Streptacidiphilus jiangxiensis]SEM72323.1 hypothetical protein SAMN05414137_1485 [Streptacidiphilus jiangxiensis]
MSNPSAPRSARLPFIAAASLLALGGSILLLPSGHSKAESPAAAQPARSAAPVVVPAPAAAPGTPAARPASSAPTTSTPSPTAAPSAPRTAPADLLAGDMPDSYLQQVLEQTQPADLPADQEKQLVALADQVLLADLTGAGRAAFPSYFAGQAATTSWTHVRVQAGIARRHPGSGNEVDAHLVYAGTDPRGQAQERQSITIVLAQAAGGTGWQPVTAP